MIWLSNKIEFPSYESTSEEGIIAVGGDLSPERLMHAYKRGIFPWYSEEYPILWHCPPERMVLFPEELKISKSMKQILRKEEFTISVNQAFEEVIRNCKSIKRNDGLGTWITDDMEKAYIQLYELGHAKSFEVWKGDELVGGLYGVDLGNVFCGESMFSKVSNASKIAFIHLIKSHNYKLIDCQVYNDHLASLGAREIPRDEFLRYLEISK
ncbi:leucyl/phenylalanyl-tRNA--protein transferase [Pseudotenacibaculum sp. MALMAid0570]|uniref:leucyl/phenylalanyl-tRNA--protein transferase n=1 Tax=Pseudotenacibaculum sp. MALMAid0570 TaxID=3143938 RepID=UPI0032E0272F